MLTFIKEFEPILLNRFGTNSFKSINHDHGVAFSRNRHNGARTVGRWGTRLLLECLWVDIFFRFIQSIAPNNTLELPALYALIAASRLLVYMLGQYLYWLYCRAQARRV